MAPRLQRSSFLILFVGPPRVHLVTPSQLAFYCGALLCSSTAPSCAVGSQLEAFARPRSCSAGFHHMAAPTPVAGISEPTPESLLYVRLERRANGRSSSKWTTVLSVDGGGLRGVLPATVLYHVERTIKRFIFENKDRLKQNIKKFWIDGDTRTPADDAPLLDINNKYNFEVHLADYFELSAGAGTATACHAVSCLDREPPEREHP